MKRALLSVYDKTGVAALAEELRRLGFELVASGGTARVLADNGVDVIPLERMTAVAEMLGHRVVTLHPRVHRGILARRDVPADAADLAQHGIDPIDLVCVNLYPFEQTIARLDVTWEDAIEQFDIGGPAMLRLPQRPRARDPAVPAAGLRDRPGRLRASGGVSTSARRALAARAFATTAAYDAAVAGFLGGDERSPSRSSPRSSASPSCRTARTRTSAPPTTRSAGGRTHLLARVEQLHGRALSFNNLNDLSAAGCSPSSWTVRACVIVSTPTVRRRRGGDDRGGYEKALAADPVSAYAASWC